MNEGLHHLDVAFFAPDHRDMPGCPQAGQADDHLPGVQSTARVQRQTTPVHVRHARSQSTPTFPPFTYSRRVFGRPAPPGDPGITA